MKAKITSNNLTIRASLAPRVQLFSVILLGPKVAIVAVEGCSPPQDLEKAVSAVWQNRLIYFSENQIPMIQIGCTDFQYTGPDLCTFHRITQDNPDKQKKLFKFGLQSFK